VIWSHSEVAVSFLNDSLKLSVSTSYLLKRRNRLRNVCALFCFFDSLRSFLHSFLNTDSFALENCKRFTVKLNDSEIARSLTEMIDMSNDWTCLCLDEHGGIAFYVVGSNNLI